MVYLWTIITAAYIEHVMTVKACSATAFDRKGLSGPVLRPADVYFRQDHAILSENRWIKEDTLKQCRLLN